MKQISERSAYWDIVKGWAIIAVVMGHCGTLSAFVYLFHLAVFFFVTGYFFNEQKYGDDPFRYFGVRLAGCWPRFVIYSACLVLLHNFFVTNGLYDANIGLYNHTAMLTSILHSAALQNTEILEGALWFVGTWLLSSVIFAGIVWFGRTAGRRLGSARIEAAAIVFGVFIAGIMGLFLYDRKCYLPYSMQCAFLVIPFYYAAWMLRRHLPSFQRYTTWYGAVVSAILLHLVNSRLLIFIDISVMDIPGALYYPIALLGIYFVLSISVLSLRVPYLSSLLAFFGRHSFDIMALHFLVFKLIDLAYVRLVPAAAASASLADFPVTFRGRLEPFYLVLGVLLPALVGWMADRAAQVLR